ncbi:aldo/keto reductase [Streptomyces sp. NPDC058545]|uniref:aldo/keto reductase n=1 Tax=Streptomyces sp. NPDC058545 TaxID=3346544 RepID=UPI003668DC05
MAATGCPARVRTRRQGPARRQYGAAVGLRRHEAGRAGDLGAAGGPGPLDPTGPAGGGARRRSHRHGRRLRLRRLEDILREALHPYPDRPLVATKVGQMQPPPGARVPVHRPAYLLRHQYEMSLHRLGVDRTNLVHLHRVDPDVPFADQIGTMKELRVEGKIAHVGP